MASKRKIPPSDHAPFTEGGVARVTAVAAGGGGDAKRGRLHALGASEYEAAQEKEWVRHHHQVHDPHRGQTAAAAAGAGDVGTAMPLSAATNPLPPSVRVDASSDEFTIRRGAFGLVTHFHRKWQRVAQFLADGVTESRPYWYHVDTGETSWVPPPPPLATLPSDAAAAAAGAGGAGAAAAGGARRGAGGGGSSSSSGGSRRRGGGRAHRKLLAPAKVVALFPDHGFFVAANQRLRCMCSRKACGPWDKEMARRHVASKTHQRMLERDVSVPMPFYSCRVKMTTLASIAIAVSGTTAPAAAAAAADEAADPHNPHQAQLVLVAEQQQHHPQQQQQHAQNQHQPLGGAGEHDALRVAALEAGAGGEGDHDGGAGGLGQGQQHGGGQEEQEDGDDDGNDDDDGDGDGGGDDDDDDDGDGGAAAAMMEALEDGQGAL